MDKLQSRLNRRRGRADDSADVSQSPDVSETPAVDSRARVIEELRQRMQKIEARREHRQADHRTDDTPLPASDSAGDDRVRRIEPLNELALPGTVLDTPMGEVWINQQLFDCDHRHGEVPIFGFLKTGEGLAALCRDDRVGSLHPAGALFLDTETTGLSGGAGTLPFLIGVGWFTDDDRFLVEHIFCRGPDEEPAQLERLSAHLGRATHLVTFNGRSFDMPLVNTRYILNRAKNPAIGLPHLDLLHVARRIFSRRLNDRSLGNLESVILGFRRSGDIPGAQIPAVYGDYLRSGITTDIARVFEHNTMDLLALAALGGVLESMYNDPEAVAHAADHLGLARSAFFAGQGERGFAHLHRADVTADDTDRQAALHLLARQAARRGDFDTAIRTLREIVDRYPDDAMAHLTLSKHCEHRLKDYAQALVHARQCSEIEGDTASERRIARLLKKST